MPDTQVIGTITDPNGLPYSFATINAILMPGGPGPSLCNGVPMQPVAPFRADINGSFALMLCPNASISPAGSHWEFNVSITPGVPAPIGFGPQAFAVSVTIAGSSQDLSGTLSAAAPVLARVSGGGGGSPAPPDMAVQFDDGGSFGGNADFTFDKTTNSFNLQGTGTGIASILYGASQETGITIDGTGPSVDLSASDIGGTLDLSADVGIALQINTGATGPISAITGPTGKLKLVLDPVGNTATLNNLETGGLVKIFADDGIQLQTTTGGMEIQATSGTIEILSDDAAVRVDGDTDVNLRINGADVVHASGSSATPTLGFFGAAPVAQPTVTGSRVSGAALASLLTELALQGLIIDGTTT